MHKQQQKSRVQLAAQRAPGHRLEPPGVQLLREDDANWPQPDRVGRQELEVILDDQHISFTTTKLGSLTQVTQSKDPEGLRVFYYLVQVRPSCLLTPIFPCLSQASSSPLPYIVQPC